MAIDWSKVKEGFTLTDVIKEENKELKQEIEKLNNIIDKKEQFLGDNIKRLEREVVKRDNIINELEKIISLDFNYVNNDLSDNFVLGIRNEAKFIYRELQELKGDNKE